MKELYDATRAAKDSNSKVTYQILKTGWFVVSGVDNGKVFYQKTILSENVFKTFRLEYDESSRKKWDPITARVSRSFKG